MAGSGDQRAYKKALESNDYPVPPTPPTPYGVGNLPVYADTDGRTEDSGRDIASITGIPGPVGPPGADGAVGPIGPQGPAGSGITAEKIRVVNSLPLNPDEGDVCFDAADNGFYIGVE